MTAYEQAKELARNLDGVVMKYSTKEQGSGFGLRQETMHCFWRNGS
ncbi:hypothetical protein SAMN05421784_1854, partial [Xenorhabdus koppenhoeferi]